MCAQRVRIGPFTLDPTTRELTTEASVVRLQEQPFRILELLVEHRGQVVARDVLRQRLWPNGTHVDFEHSLNAAMKRLRAALGDTVERPRFIETLPRIGYRLLVADGAEPALEGMPRLAVLPFADLRQGTPEDYLAEGLADELIAELGRRLRGRFAVIARASSMSLKGTVMPAREIGAALGARYLIEGSVRAEGSRARIAVALLDSHSDARLWSELYDYEVDGFLELQASVARRTAEALALQVIADPSHVEVSPDSNAHHLFLKGRFHWNRAAGAGMGDALDFFQRAHAADPRWALPLGSLARTQIVRAEYYADTPRALLESARDTVMAGAALSRSLPDLWLARGEISRMLDWDWSGAATAYATAIRLNASIEDGYRMNSLLLAARGDHRRAMDDATMACDLDPLCVLVHANAAWVAFLAGDYDATVRISSDVLDLDRRHQWALRTRAAAHLRMGDRAKAACDARDAYEYASADLLNAAMLVQAADRASREAWEGLCERVADLTGRGMAGRIPHYEVALACLTRGDEAAVMVHLDHAMAMRDPLVSFLAVDPRWEPLAERPSYRDALRQLGLDRAAATSIGAVSPTRPDPLK